MRAIRKKILTDENMQPVAVQIDYPDWLWLESLMSSAKGTNGQALTGPQDVPGTPSSSPPDLNRLAGTLRLREDPLAWQQRARDEWK